MGDNPFTLVAEKGESGRVRKVKWLPRQGAPRVFSGVEFREKLGNVQFPSAFFSIQQQGNQFVFEGSGYGHGVGLCQWGAKVMGEKGYSASVILSHYYPDAKIEKFYP